MSFSTFPSGNKLLLKYEQKRVYDNHMQKLQLARSTISNSKPKSYPHLVLPLKKIQNEEEHQAEVDHENKLLLQKMTKIMKKPNPEFWNQYESKSLNTPARRKQLRDIQMENIGIARRLEKTQPVIRSDAMEEEYQHKRYLQSLWNDSSKDFDTVIPRHKKYRQIRKLREEALQAEQNESEKADDSSKDTERLPPIMNSRGSNRQSVRYNTGPESYRSSKSDSLTKNDRRSEDDLQSNTGSQINNSQLDTDTKAIFKVAKQLAQPDDVFIKHLVRRSHKHRLQIKKRFRELYDLDLIAELKSGLGNEWNPLIDALLKERNNSSARSIHDALEIGDYSTAVEILFSCKNADFPELRESYRKEYAVSLENDIHDKTEDSEQALLMVLQTGERDEGIKVDEKLAEIDANDLYESGDGRWSSDTGKFMKMLKVRNNKHIKVVLNLYKVCNGGVDATEDIKRECSRNYAEALTTLINCLRGSENHYADALFRSMSATDPTFVNLLVLRSEIDIPAVRRAYKKKYDAELVDDIRHKCVHRTTTVLMEIANRTPPNYPKGKTPQQRKWGGANMVTHTPRQPVKRPERQKEVETKSKHNPLAQPSMRVAADTVAMRKEEDREKQEEKERKREHERQKKNISGTIKPATNFNPVSDCERLHDTLSKHDTDETVFIDILPSKSNSQRQILKRKYQEKYHKNLTDEMNSRISGDFEEIVLGLMMTPAEYDAHSLHEALDGFGVTESTLIGILCTRDSVEMKEIKEQYKKAYKTDLVQDLQSETSDLTELLVALSKGERDQAKTVNLQEAQKDAKKLYRNGEIAIDTKDAVFINLLVKKNHSQVKATFQEYEKLAGHDMYQGISNAMLEDAENGYIAIARAAADPTQYFAERLEMCFSGIGTNDNALIRIIVSRSEIDLRDIKARYQQLYGKSLSRMIKDECSGDYKQMLLAILGDQ